MAIVQHDAGNPGHFFDPRIEPHIVIESLPSKRFKAKWLYVKTSTFDTEKTIWHKDGSIEVWTAAYIGSQFWTSDRNNSAQVRNWKPIAITSGQQASVTTSPVMRLRANSTPRAAAIMWSSVRASTGGNLDLSRPSALRAWHSNQSWHSRNV